MNTVKTYIAPSKIQGIGLFAAEFIPKGATVWRLNPNFDIVIPKDKLAEFEASLPELELQYFRRYAYYEEDSVVFCSGDGKYYNHSTTPNTANGPDDTCIATRDIFTGEELTCDYAEICKGGWSEDEFNYLKSHGPNKL